MSRRQGDALTVGTFRLHLTVVTGEEDHQIGFLGCLDCLCHQLRVGRLLRTETFVTGCAVKALVARHVGQFHLVAQYRLQAFEGRDLTAGLHTSSHTAKCHLGNGILADDSDAPDVLGIYRQQMFVLQEHDAATRHLQGCLHLFGIAYRLGVGYCLIHWLHRESYAQDLPDALIDNDLTHLTCLDGVEQRLSHIATARHLDIHACHDSIYRRVHPTPVADHHTGEAPLLAQDGGEQWQVLGAPAPVHLVISCHQAPGVRLAHSHLEGTEIDLMHGTIGDAHIHEATIVLLIVQGIVFQAYCRSILLCALGVSHRQHSAQQGILAKVLVGSSARRDALDIDGRSEDHIFSTQTCLTAHAPSVGVGTVSAPRGSQCRPRGEKRGRVGSEVGGVPGVRFHLLADAEGAVGIFHIGNPQTGYAGRREHVLTVQHADLLFECHAADDVVDLLLMVEQLGGILLGLCRCSRHQKHCQGTCSNSFHFPINLVKTLLYLDANAGKEPTALLGDEVGVHATAVITGVKQVVDVQTEGDRT